MQVEHDEKSNDVVKEVDEQEKVSKGIKGDKMGVKENEEDNKGKGQTLKIER